MFDVIREACVRMLTEYNDFWLLAMLTNSSYEEEGSAQHTDFKRAVGNYEEAGIPQATICRLRRGVNGNLRLLLPGCKKLCIGSRRPDLALCDDAGLRALGEVKLLYDCAECKQYNHHPRENTVPHDRRRLGATLTHKDVPTQASGFQIVFFTQLPHFDRPPGRWKYLPGNGRVPARKDYVVYGTIEQQFRVLRESLPQPTWPAQGPRAHPLALCSVDAARLRERYSAYFVPDVHGWEFSAAEHLRDAQVGVAIWDVPRTEPAGVGAR